MVECFDPERDACVISATCNLKPVLAGAADAFLAHLDGFTLADVLNRRQKALKRALGV